MKVERVAFADVRGFRGEVAREPNVGTLKDTRKTYWFRCSGGEGFAGLISAGRGKWRIKSVYVKPEHRGTGCGLALTEAMFEFAEDVLGATAIEAISKHRKFWERQGFTPSEMKPGKWRFTRRLR